MVGLRPQYTTSAADCRRVPPILRYRDAFAEGHTKARRQVAHHTTGRRAFETNVQWGPTKGLYRATDAAGCPNSAVLDFGNGTCPANLAMIRRYAEGTFGDERFWSDDRLVPDGAKVPAICETLRCSADYLLGMSEELTPQAVSKSDAGFAWQTGTEYPDGGLVADVEDHRGRRYEILYARNGALFWDAAYCDPMPKFAAADVLRWAPLPELPKEDDDAET